MNIICMTADNISMEMIEMNDNEKIPVPDPFSKDYEYLFPSASWENITDEKAVSDTENSIFPYLTDPDFRLYE
ncbi:MAG: hypothetical protein K2J08_01395 [Ruminococcus sp.]|nr:hypothetical protein [Ruminococcus sp.]